MKLEPAVFMVTSVRLRVRLAPWEEDAPPELLLEAEPPVWELSGVEPSGREASGAGESGMEASGMEMSVEEPPVWPELVEELLPGLEEEVPLDLPPQAARDRTMAQARTAAKIRLFIIK